MRVLTWNVRQGGSKSPFYSIINYLVEHDADVMVLTEFVDNEKGKALAKNLYAAGYTYQNDYVSPYKNESMLVTSKYAFEDVTDMKEWALPKERWQELFFPEKDVYLLAIHIPQYMTSVHDRRLFLQQLLAYGQKRAADSSIMIGDYNTSWMLDSQGIVTDFRDYLQQLNDLGWTQSCQLIDKHPSDCACNSPIEYGFRIDLAYISPPLKKKVIACEFSQHGPLEEGSEHHVLQVTLNS